MAMLCSSTVARKAMGVAAMERDSHLKVAAMLTSAGIRLPTQMVSDCKK